MFHIFRVRKSQKVKKCFHVKSSTYYFQMTTVTFADFQMRVSVPLISKIFKMIFA